MIFFDIDDTLLDYKSSQDFAAKKFSELYADRLLVDSQDFLHYWDAISREQMNRYLAGELTFQEQRRSRILASISGVNNDLEADSLFNNYLSVYENSWQLFPDCIEALEKLGAYRLGVITNGDLEQQRTKLKKLNIAHYFDIVVTPADAGAAKPDSKIFEFAVSLSGVPAEECWYIGDDFENDYLAAKKGNLNSIWLKRRTADNITQGMCTNLLEFAMMVSQN